MPSERSGDARPRSQGTAGRAVPIAGRAECPASASGPPLTLLRYESAGRWQRRAIIASLENPVTSIFIAARLLADLRNSEFGSIPGDRLTREQIEVLGARYNRGPSTPRERLDLDYGRDITKRWRYLRNLLSGR